MSGSTAVASSVSSVSTMPAIPITGPTVQTTTMSPLEMIFANEELTHIRDQILAYTLIIRDKNGEQTTISPYFGTGMRVDPYLPQSRDRPLDLVDESCQSTVFVVKDNQTHLNLCLASRSFTNIVLKVFYSRNKFKFTDPRVAAWFFKLIGKRFKVIKNVEFEIHSGLETYAWNHTLTESHEGLWHGLLCWIQYRHGFEKLCIRIQGLWRKRLDGLSVRTENKDGSRGLVRVPDHVIEEMKMSRENLKHQLGQLRDIREPKLEDEWNLLLNNADIMDGQLLMKQKGRGEMEGLTEEEEEHKEEQEKEERQALKSAGIRRLLEKIHLAKKATNVDEDQDELEGDAPRPEEDDDESDELPELVNTALSSGKLQDTRPTTRVQQPAASNWGFDPPDSRSVHETKPNEPQERERATMRYQGGAAFDATAAKFLTQKKGPQENAIEGGKPAGAIDIIPSAQFYGPPQCNTQPPQSRPQRSQAQPRGPSAGKKYGKKDHARPDIWGY
jgi:hypothetical protein